MNLGSILNNFCEDFNNNMSSNTIGRNPHVVSRVDSAMQYNV